MIIIGVSGSTTSLEINNATFGGCAQSGESRVSPFDSRPDPWGSEGLEMACSLQLYGTTATQIVIVETRWSFSVHFPCRDDATAGSTSGCFPGGLPGFRSNVCAFADA